MKLVRRIKISDIAVVVALVGCLFLYWQSTQAKSGLECPPQPFPITLPPELADVPGMREFAEHIDRQIEEIYLRFCFHVDSLKDSLVVGDSLVYDSVHVGDSTVLDSVTICCPTDSLPDTDEGCTEYADKYFPCQNTMTFDADAYYITDDTGGGAGDAVGGTIDMYFSNAAKTKAVSLTFPNGPNGSYEINFPDSFPSWTNSRFRLNGAGTQKLIYWERDDDAYVQYGQKQILGSGATPGTTYVALSVSYATTNYRVQLTPVDVYLRGTWKSSTVMGGGGVRVWNDASWGQHAVDTFVILHPVDDTFYVEWMTVGDITGFHTRP